MSVPGLQFEPATPADAGALLGWVRAYYAEDHLAFDAAAVLPALTRLIQEPALGRAHFLTRGGERLGYTVWTFGFDHEFGGPTATVTDLFVAPAHRGGRIATAALAFIAQTCRAFGVRALELQVERENLAAQALYRKFGFRPLPRLPLHLPLD